MKDIIGYEGLYAITSCGKVYSYRNKKFLKPHKDKASFLRVSLHKDKEIKHQYIHRLVAEAYSPNPDNLRQVRHKDENKENNALPNLEWCPMNYQKCNQKPRKPVHCIELNRTFTGAAAAARELGLGSGNITSCCTGKRKTCGGYHWRYQEVDSNVKTQTT